MKDMFELQCIINLREACFGLFNRSIPFLPKEQFILKPKEQGFIKIEALFIGKISGLVIAKILDKKGTEYINTQGQICKKLSYIRCCKQFFEAVILDPKDMIGILDLR